jgi:hypothetical protein
VHGFVGVFLLKKERRVIVSLAHCLIVSSVAPQPEWDNFFTGWDLTRDTAKAGDIVVTCGDFNSSMGNNLACNKAEIDSREMRQRAVEASGGLGPFGEPHRNNAGRRLSSHTASKGMVTCSTYFDKKQYTTWTHPRSKKGHQLDQAVVLFFNCRNPVA